MSLDRPNILFLMTDHQRADSIGMVQDGKPVAPNLDRLAERAAHFRRAYNTCPLCAPARTALATGVPPHTNGVIVNDWKGETAGDYAPMHEFLARAGYRVGHVGVHHIRVSPPIEERVPFAMWYSNPDYARYLREQGLPARERGGFTRECRELGWDGQWHVRAYSSTRTAVFPHPAEHFMDYRFADAACRFLADAPGDQPFALFVYFWAPHPPLIVPEPYASLFRPEGLEIPGNVGRCAEPEPDAVALGVPRQLAQDEDDWRRVWAAHLGLVRLADDGIGRILSTLEQTGRADETAVVFTTDHGDHLGAHCMYQKMEMYEEAIRVPLLIHAPGAPARSYDGLTSHLDLMPTVLDLAGIDKPDYLAGRSLAEVVGNGAGFGREAVFSGYDGNPESGVIRRAVVTEGHKYIWHALGGEEIYDLRRDPGELVNLAGLPEHAATRARLETLGRKNARATGDRAWS